MQTNIEISTESCFVLVGSSSKYSRQVAKNTPILREICEANGFNANPIYILHFNVLIAYIPYIFKL